MPYGPTVAPISNRISALGSTPALIHFTLCIVRHIDQSKLVEHPVDIGHAPDIAQRFWTVNHRSDLFYTAQRKQYRPSRQALTAFSTIDPQFLGQFPIPPGLDLIRKRQSGYRLEPLSLKSNRTLPEMLFIMTALQRFNCFLPLPHSSKSLCHNADLVSVTFLSEIHAFLIR